MNKVRLGIIGIGNMGSGHVESILDGKVPEIELAAVADLRESRRFISSLPIHFLQEERYDRGNRNECRR